MTDTITRAFESLQALPILEGGFLRRLLLQAIDDPELATNPALAEHLYLVPSVVRVLPPATVHHVMWAGKTLDDAAADVASGRSDISLETLSKLARVALRDPPFLANFLAGHPASPFLPPEYEGSTK